MLKKNDNSTGIELVHILDAYGTTDLVDSISLDADINLTIESVRDRLDGTQYSLIKFLVLGGSLLFKEASQVLGADLLSCLSELGVLSFERGRLSLSGLSLRRYRGMWFFCDAPYPSSTLYFGTDSIALASRLRGSRGGRALDLCAGPGIQSLILASLGMRVDAVDINPCASEICRLNAFINGMSDDITVLTGDLLNPVEDGVTYNLIVVNPPLLPIPDDIPYPFVGDGGADGIAIIRKILNKVSDRLLPEGELLAVGMAERDEYGLLVAEEVEGLLVSSGLSGVLTVISSYSTHRGSRWSQAVALTSKAYAPMNPDSVQDVEMRLSRAYTRDGACAVCTYVLRAWPSPSPKLLVQDFSGADDAQMPWRIA